ncbi:MAG: hypothetical protein R3E12_14005 [Candidatus Eisenbacteria bacterium]
MSSDQTFVGFEVRLRPRGVGRFVNATFLGVWMCGWAAGEGFAIWALIHGARSLLRGESPTGGDPTTPETVLPFGLFLLVWLGLWTFGGIAAGRELLRSLWSEDRLVVESGRLILHRRIGPFRSKQEYERDAIRRIDLSRSRGALSLWTSNGQVDLSSLGTVEEREQAVVWLRNSLGLRTISVPEAPPALPQGWEEILTPEGERAVVRLRARRAARARFLGALALLLAAGGYWTMQRDPALPFGLTGTLFALAGLATWGVWHLAWVRAEWVIGSRTVRLQRRDRGKRSVEFEALALEINVTRDSDGDEWFRLEALSQPSAGSEPASPFATSSPKGKRFRRTLLSTMRDPTDPQLLGDFLARASGLPLTDRSTPAARTASWEEARAQLERSGRFGKWLARVIDPLAARRRSGSR